MIFKTAPFLCKTISTCWYTTNKGVQIKSIANDLVVSKQTRPYRNYI